MPSGSGPTDRDTPVSEMTEKQIHQFLTRQGLCTFSVSDRDGTYSIPMSFGFDDGKIYFHLAVHDRSQKMNALEQTQNASALAYSFESPSNWASVLVRGPVSPVPEEEHDVAISAFADNAQFTEMGLFQYIGPTDSADFEYYQLEPVETSGLYGTHFEFPDE